MKKARWTNSQKKALAGSISFRNLTMYFRFESVPLLHDHITVSAIISFRKNTKNTSQYLNFRSKILTLELYALFCSLILFTLIFFMCNCVAILTFPKH